VRPSKLQQSPWRRYHGLSPSNQVVDPYRKRRSLITAASSAQCMQLTNYWLPALLEAFQMKKGAQNCTWAETPEPLCF